MIWHILKKDWKLMWPMAVGLALIGLVYRIILSKETRFGNFRTSSLLNLSYTFGEIGILGIALLILMVVQVDAIPGLRQDWLVRPIRRTDLLLSKLMFVVLAVQFPIFVIEVGQALAAGFPISQSIGAALQHSLTMLCAFELPVLTLAVLTRNLAEAMGAVIVFVVALALFATAAIGLMVRDTNGVAWVSDALMAAWGTVAGAVIVSLQYYWRKTLLARAIGGFSVLGWLCLMLLPWPAAFAIEKRFSPAPEAARAVEIAFDRWKSSSRGAGKRAPDIYTDIGLPVRIGGLADGQILMSERFDARLKALNGEVINLGTQRIGSRFLDWWQMVSVPRSVFNRFKDQPVKLEIDYWVTLLKADPVQGLPAVDGNRLLPGIGSCATRVNEEAAVPGLIELRCMTPGTSPCATWFLQNPLTGQHGDEGSGCPADYAPWVNHIDSDSLSRFGGILQFRDFPGPLKDAQVMVRLYRPQAHFTRRMTTPEIRLSDWSVK